MNDDEKLVLEGGKVKVVTQARQTASIGDGQSGVILDYLRFTVRRDEIANTQRVPVDSSDQDLARLLAMQFAVLVGHVLGVDRPGRDYYEFTTTIENQHGHEVGSVSAGGDGQRGTICFTLKGEGCSFARENWERRVFEHFADFKPKITRIDLARDFYAGEVDMSEVVGHYDGGSFNYRNRRPSYTQFGKWKTFADELPNSRTFQVGRRDSGKLCRCYEKGHQYRIMDSEWLRVEVEFRSVNRVIPWDAMVKPAGYFAGAYDFTAWVVDQPVAVRIPTASKVSEHGAQACVNWIQRVVAPTLVVMASAMPDFDWLENIVVDQLHRRMPKSLRGLSHAGIQSGLAKALGKFSQSNASVPAAPMFHTTPV